MTGCTVSGNSSFYGGGLVAYKGGDITLTNCTVSGISVANDFNTPNTFATGYGGGGALNLGGTLALTNCTLSSRSLTPIFHPTRWMDECWTVSKLSADRPNPFSLSSHQNAGCLLYYDMVRAYTNHIVSLLGTPPRGGECLRAGCLRSRLPCAAQGQRP